MGQDISNVLSLARTAGAHDSLWRTQRRLQAFVFLKRVHAHFLQRHMYARGRQGVGFRARRVQLLQDPLCRLGEIRLTAHAKHVSSVSDLDTQILLDLAQMLIVQAADVGEAFVVCGGEAELDNPLGHRLTRIFAQQFGPNVLTILSV